MIRIQCSSICTINQIPISSFFNHTVDPFSLAILLKKIYYRIMDLIFEIKASVSFVKHNLQTWAFPETQSQVQIQRHKSHSCFLKTLFYFNQHPDVDAQFRFWAQRIKTSVFPRCFGVFFFIFTAICSSASTQQSYVNGDEVMCGWLLLLPGSPESSLSLPFHLTH